MVSLTLSLALSLFTSSIAASNIPGAVEAMNFINEDVKAVVWGGNKEAETLTQKG